MENKQPATGPLEPKEKLTGGDGRTPSWIEETATHHRLGQTHPRGGPRPRLAYPLGDRCPFYRSLHRLSALGSSSSKDLSQWRIMEVFSEPRVTPMAQRAGFSVTNPASFDKRTGWDFFKAEDRAEFWKVY